MVKYRPLSDISQSLIQRKICGAVVKFAGKDLWGSVKFCGKDLWALVKFVCRQYESCHFRQLWIKQRITYVLQLAGYVSRCLLLT